MNFLEWMYSNLVMICLPTRTTVLRSNFLLHFWKRSSIDGPRRSMTMMLYSSFFPQQYIRGSPRSLGTMPSLRYANSLAQYSSWWCLDLIGSSFTATICWVFRLIAWQIQPKEPPVTRLRSQQCLPTTICMRYYYETERNVRALVMMENRGNIDGYGYDGRFGHMSHITSLFTKINPQTKQSSSSIHHPSSIHNHPQTPQNPIPPKQVYPIPNPSLFKAILSHLNNQKMSDQAERLIRYACSKIKDEDITHRGFLKPIQIHLKTYKTEFALHDTHLKPTSLPAGLKIAVKESILNNKYELQNIEEIPLDSKFADLKVKGQDNILTLMKERDGIELAICVCMYSEDKKMLKSTLAGVAENISNLVTRQNISSDKIGVFVLMDGIEKVDPSVVDYFQELERMNNINLGENIAPSLSIEEMAKRARTMTEEQINQEEMRNVNNFLFDPAELLERNERRFSSVRHQYEEIKKLLNTIKKLKKEKPLYDDLPNKLRPFFINQAREEYKKEYSETDEVVRMFSEEKLLDEYGTNIKKIRPLIIRTLNQGERYCYEYINSREDLAYLASFRTKVRHSIDKLPEKNKEKKYMDDSELELTDEMTENQFHTFMNLFLCVKYKNSGKLSSHNWFFNGFCKELKPKYAVLLDVGLKPEGEALHKMYKYMKNNQKVGGVCGYMSLKIERLEESEEIDSDQVDFLTNLSMKFADIQRTQQVEYHFAHLMDKPFQASFGFIHVLPGAFSAYNMNAILQYNKEDDQLLKSYFKSIDEKMKNNKIVPSDLSIGNVLMKVLLPDFVNNCFIDINPESEEQMLYNENIFLAEDRILCMGIHKKGFDMAYLPDAYAEVDPIKTVHGLLGQRKRWINGSFFAFEKVKKQLSQHEKTNGYEVMLHFQMFYLTLMNALSYFAPSFFLFTVDIAMQAFRADVLPNVLGGVITDPNNNQFYNGFVYTIDFIYVIMICSIIFMSLHLTNGNKRFKPYLYAVSTIFGIFSIIVFTVLLVDVIRGLADNSAFLLQNQAFAGTIPGGIGTINAMRWILVGSTVIYIVPIVVYMLMFRKANILWEIIIGAFSFLFYGPTYLNILNIYSLCRIDDISWGTKGLDSGASSQNSKLKDSWKLIKFVHVSKYVIWNIIMSVILISLGSSYTPRFFITIIVIILMGTSLSVKIVVGLLYMIKYKLSNCMCCADREKYNIVESSRVDNLIKSYKGEIMEEVRGHLNDMRKSYVDPEFKQRGGSFIQASRSKKNVEKSFKKQKKDFQSKSKIIPKSGAQKLSLANSRNPKKLLSPIMEENQYPSSKKKNDRIPNPRIPQITEESESPQKFSNDGMNNSSLAKDEKVQDLRPIINPQPVLGTNDSGFKPVQKSKQKKYQNKKKG